MTKNPVSAIIILHIKSAESEKHMHYSRHADETIRKLSKMFGAVLVTGARQVGKTTLL